MTLTGRSGKRVDASRQEKCRKRAQGNSFYGDTRGFMLERIYRVPSAWKNAYDQYTDERALEDLASCARGGTLPWSHKVVRYDKLGIAKPADAVAYALRRYHGFDERDMRQLRKTPDVLPYDTFSALRNIRRERTGKTPRFEVSRLLGLVTDRKRGTRFYSSTHLAPRTTHKYDYRAAWTQDDKRRARRARPRIDRDSPVYALVRNDLQGRAKRGINSAANNDDDNNNNNNNAKPPTRPSHFGFREPVPRERAPGWMPSDQAAAYEHFLEMYLTAAARRRRT